MTGLEAWSRVHALVMLIAAGIALAFALPLSWPALAALSSFALLLYAGRGRYTPQGGFGVANALSVLRLVLLCALGVLEPAPGPRVALLLLLVFALDGLDGWMARRRGESSAFGAQLDMEVDGIFVLLAALLLFRDGRLAAFILLAGLMRYLYVLTLWVARASAAQAPASRFGRYSFGLMAVALCASAWPLPLHGPLALFATLWLIWSFGRSLAWSLARRASS